MPVLFPYNAKFQSVQFTMVGMGKSGGTGLSGAMTRVASNSGHWKAQATFAIYGSDSFLAWEGFLAAMQGVIGETEVPAWARIRPFDQDGHELGRLDAVDFGGGPIADNSGLGHELETHATLKTAASLRDTIIQVEYDNTTGIRPGHKIGIGDRLHEVVYSYGETAGETTLQISPPLRKGYSAGERVILDRPKCKMRFETETEGRIPYDTSPMRSVTVNFREVF